MESDHADPFQVEAQSIIESGAEAGHLLQIIRDEAEKSRGKK